MSDHDMHVRVVDERVTALSKALAELGRGTNRARVDIVAAGNRSDHQSAENGQHQSAGRRGGRPMRSPRIESRPFCR
jgi:hypothetical protein